MVENRLKNRSNYLLPTVPARFDSALHGAFLDQEYLQPQSEDENAPDNDSNTNFDRESSKGLPTDTVFGHYHQIHCFCQLVAKLFSGWVEYSFVNYIQERMSQVNLHLHKSPDQS